MTHLTHEFIYVQALPSATAVHSGQDLFSPSDQKQQQLTAGIVHSFSFTCVCLSCWRRRRREREKKKRTRESIHIVEPLNSWRFLSWQVVDQRATAQSQMARQRRSLPLHQPQLATTTRTATAKRTTMVCFGWPWLGFSRIVCCGGRTRFVCKRLKSTDQSFMSLIPISITERPRYERTNERLSVCWSSVFVYSTPSHTSSHLPPSHTHT